MPIPRRQINEVILRADLSKIITLIVEGPNDERVLNLVKVQKHSPPPIQGLDVQCVETIELDIDLLRAQGIETAGARQRVIAFSRMMEKTNKSKRVHSLIDRDIDDLLGQNLEHTQLHYTDYGCIDGYLWDKSTLRSFLYHFRCESKFKNEGEDVTALFDSINEACKIIAIVRAVSVSYPSYQLRLVEPTKCLTVDGFILRLDYKKYLGMCGGKGKSAKEIEDIFDKLTIAKSKLSPLLLLNSHDLILLISHAVKALTKGSKYIVNDDSVFNCLFSHGVQRTEILENKLFHTLVDISNKYAE